MKLVLTCCLLFIVSGCFEVEEKAVSASMETPHEYRWATVPQKLYYSKDFPSNYQSYTSDMSQEWNNLFPTHTFISVEGHPTLNYEENFTTIEAVSRDRHNVIYLVDSSDWPTSSDTALGVAILMGRVNDHGQFIIEESDVLIRNPKGDSSYDPETIIIHELGHLLGLQHQYISRDLRSTTVMYPSIAVGETKTRPTALDKKTIAKLYGISSGAIPHSRRELKVPAGKGDLTRMIFELGADMNCRHLLNGVEIHSHSVELK